MLASADRLTIKCRIEQPNRDRLTRVQNQFSYEFLLAMNTFTLQNIAKTKSFRQKCTQYSCRLIVHSVGIIQFSTPRQPEALPVPVPPISARRRRGPGLSARRVPRPTGARWTWRLRPRSSPSWSSYGWRRSNDMIMAQVSFMGNLIRSPDLRT